MQAGPDGFAEYRGIMVPKAAGTFLPSLSFVWRDTDENGPNVNHQSVVRDIEAFPGSDFTSKNILSPGKPGAGSGVRWSVTGKILTVNTPAETVRVDLYDLWGRLIGSFANNDSVRLRVPEYRGAVVVRVRAGIGKKKETESRFVLCAVGR